MTNGSYKHCFHFTFFGFFAWIILTRSRRNRISDFFRLKNCSFLETFWGMICFAAFFRFHININEMNTQVCGTITAAACQKICSLIDDGFQIKSWIIGHFLFGLFRK